jgi:hypothetical protein
MRAQSSRGLRCLTLISAVTPVLLAVVPGCSDTINNDYTTIIRRGPAAAGEGGDAAYEPPQPTAGKGSHPNGGSSALPSTGNGGGGAGSDDDTPMGGEAGNPSVDEAHVLYPDAPYADTPVASQVIDLFGTIGTKFWFGVNDEQLNLMNNGGGKDPGFPGQFGDPYTPGGGSADGPFADYLWVTAAGDNGQTADYGKVGVKVVGQSSRREWSKQSIPNLNIDSNDFVEKQLINGYEHLRLNNAQVGNIFREYLSLKLYAALDYPAPHVSYAFVGSNVWGKGIEVPMVLVERYKRHFCERIDGFGNECPNMYEFAGDFQRNWGFPGPKLAEGVADMGVAAGGAAAVGGAMAIGGMGVGGGIVPPGGMAAGGYAGGGIAGGGNPDPGPLPWSIFDDPSYCQVDNCDTTRVKELESLVYYTPQTDGFEAALADYIDWPAFHRFQCLSWVLATGDDALHNTNNVVLAEGKDGKFRYLPYSTDISLGQDWYPYVQLPGQNSISTGCQADQSCWEETLATCQDVIDDFTALDPVKMLDNLHDMLKDAGMLRGGDEDRYAQLKRWFEGRLRDLPTELESYRNPPQGCPKGQVDCGGYCDYPENCGVVCKPPVGKLAAAAPPPVDMGVGGAGPIIDPPAGGAGDVPVCPMIQNYPVKL